MFSGTLVSSALTAYGTAMTLCGSTVTLSNSAMPSTLARRASVKVQTNPQQASVQPDLLVHGADGVVDGAQVLDGLGTAVSGVGDHGHDPAPVGPQCLAERG